MGFGPSNVGGVLGDLLLEAPASGGSAPGSGRAGHDLSGALALLLGAALDGKFLWHARDLLRPDSVFGPIVNQPS